MKFIQYSSRTSLDKEMLASINSASERLMTKLKTIDIDQIGISTYYKEYLQNYIQHFEYFARLYNQLFIKAFELDTELRDKVLIDYGGGNGILSLLAVELGVKKVIYIDINEQVSKDAIVLGQALSLKASKYIVGDIEKLVCVLKSEKIQPGFICSFDVIEHIYNPQEWIRDIFSEFRTPIILSMTSANGYNPFVSRRLRKYHKVAEYIGFTNTDELNSSENVLPYYELRRGVIEEFDPSFTHSEIDSLAKQTRGLTIHDMKKQLKIYQEQKKIEYQPSHPTNTCDPFTGNWVENIIDVIDLKKCLNSSDLVVEIIPTLYSPSNNKIINILKNMLNICIEGFRTNSLLFSPGYILIAHTKK